MHRRHLLGLAAGTAVALAGCTASALSNPDRSSDDEPTPDCPAVIDVDRTLCPGTDGPLAFERSSGTVSGDAWSLVVSGTNRSEAPIGFNPYAWSVHRRTPDGWEHVAPDAYIEPWYELATGERYTWQLTDGADEFEGADQRVALDLDAGTYAFAVPLQAGEPLGAVATFEVVD